MNIKKVNKYKHVQSQTLIQKIKVFKKNENIKKVKR
jgi:hypothetical protein